MSGPKVVRVVTKQEMIATCQGRIDALQNVIAQWRKFAAKHDCLTTQEEKAVDEEFQSIIKMLQYEQFDAVQRQCAIKIASVQEDMIRIRNEVVAKAEQERSIRRRLQYSAETLIKSFEVAGRQVPEELFSIVSSVLVVDQSGLVAISSTLSRILTEFSISSVENDAITPLQKELSKQLSDGERLQTLAEWKIQYDLDPKAIDADRRLDKLLAEIEIIKNETVAKPFVDRVSLIAQEASSSHRSLLTDSLIFDLTTYLNEQKAKDQAITSMRETYSALCRLTIKEAKDLAVPLAKAIASEDVTSGMSLNERSLGLLKAETKTLISTSRREAILKGLSELGYEVRENMSTAWAQDGRIIVKKPNDNDYGVELGAVQDVERVQVRLVTFEQSSDVHNAARDLDRETIWCSQFTNLKLLLQKAGTALHIEKALPVGSKPLKRVKESAVSVTRDRRTKSSSFKKKQQDL